MSKRNIFYIIKIAIPGTQRNQKHRVDYYKECVKMHLLFDGPAFSYAWLFKVFLESMRNHQPKIIFTYQDTTIAENNIIFFFTS